MLYVKVDYCAKAGEVEGGFVAAVWGDQSVVGGGAALEDAAAAPEAEDPWRAGEGDETDGEAPVEGLVEVGDCFVAGAGCVEV